MPLLQHKLAFRDVLKYSQDVSLVEQPSGDDGELQVLLVVKVGEGGQLKTEARLQQRTGILAGKVVEQYCADDQRVIDALGATLEPLGKAPLGFLPVLPAHEVKQGDTWTAAEFDSTGQRVTAEYELASLGEGEPQAEILGRRREKGSEVETLYEFSIAAGRVTAAQSVMEVPLKNLGSLRLMVEYRLL